MTAQTDRLNTALAGRYRIERHLGEGGMASVYLCEDLKHDRKVALKLLKPELAAVLGAERFVQEIKTTASLQHPHILPLFDSGTADGFLFYVMPYIEGETLRAKLSRETQLGVDEAVRIAREVLDALEYAHQHGIVHRDVKPENILLHGGHAMVADFGIALAVSAAAGGRMTETGLSLGTPHYMSPEQATAEKEITARSDVYSLGSVLYEMLAGTPPHTGASAQQIVMKIIAEPVQPVTMLRRAVPVNVAAAVGKALEKFPADRFESAKAFSEALANSAYSNESFSGAGMAASGGAPRARNIKRLATATSALAAVSIVAALWGWLRPAPIVVSRQRIVLWEDQRIPRGRLAHALAIAPDGGTVVFIDSSPAGVQLYAKERDRSDASPLAGSTGVAGAPAYSPDGAWVAFVARDGRLLKIPRGGGSAIAIADSANVVTPAVAWIAGGTILYVDLDFGLRSVGEDGGAVQKLYEPASDTTRRGIVSVTGLPGGHAVLLGVCTIGCVTSALRVLDLQSRRMTELAGGGLAGWPLSGGLIAFVRQDGGVWAAPFNLHHLTFERPPAPVMDGVRPGVGADIVASAGGTVIYVQGAPEVGQEVSPVWVTRGGVVTPIDTALTMTLGVRGGRAVALSPDGQRLAVEIARPGDATRRDVWIKQLDRGPLTKLTFDGDNIGPVWTLDGRHVLFTSGGILPGSLRRRRSDGTGPVDTLLTLPRIIWEVVPTLDSALFILRLGLPPPPREIVQGRQGDSASSLLVSSAHFSAVTPALSPNGRWLAYASDESGRLEVYVRPYPNVNAGRWQVSQSGGSSPVWSRSGNELLFCNGANALVSASVISGVTFVLGAQKKLFDASQFATRSYFNVNFDIAADGSRFVFLRPIGASRPATPDKLIEVTNWATEVQAKLAGKAPK